LIYIDLDGVLADLVAQVEAYLFVKSIYNKTNYGEYKIQDACSITANEIYLCFSIERFWSSMPKTDWADEIVSWAKSVSPEEEIYLLSRPWLLDSVESTISCLKGKSTWVAENFPEFCGRMIFSDVKSVFAKDSLLLDDNKENCEDFAKHGGKTIFIPTPWGDKNYGTYKKSGKELIQEVLKCEKLVVENM